MTMKFEEHFHCGAIHFQDSSKEYKSQESPQPSTTVLTSKVQHAQVAGIIHIHHHHFNTPHTNPQTAGTAIPAVLFRPRGKPRGNR